MCRAIIGGSYIAWQAFEGGVGRRSTEIAAGREGKGVSSDGFTMTDTTSRAISGEYCRRADVPAHMTRSFLGCLFGATAVSYGAICFLGGGGHLGMLPDFEVWVKQRVLFVFEIWE